MGTRADFYVGRGERAEWVGSIAWDGYPDGIEGDVLRASTEPAYRAALGEFFRKNEDATVPEQGWPWPWATSSGTDYAYAFDDGRVHASAFGSSWFDPVDDPNGERGVDGTRAVFPDMRDRQRVTLGPRSGVLAFGLHRK